MIPFFPDLFFPHICCVFFNFIDFKNLDGPTEDFNNWNNLHDQNFAFNEKAWEKASEAAPEQDIWWATALRGQDPFIDHYKESK